MAWSTPRTWKGDPQDRQIRDNLNHLYGGRPAIVVRTVANVSIPHDVLTDLTFAEIYQSQGSGVSMWVAASPTQVTIPEAGWYAVCLNYQWASNPVGRRFVAIEPNDSGTYLARDEKGKEEAAGRYQSSVPAARYFAAGAYLKIVCLQASGAALAIAAYLSVVRIA